MTVTKLFADIRASYVGVLSQAIAEAQAFGEPALRRADGSLVMDGIPPLPYRVDLIPKSGELAGEFVTVDAKSQLAFAPISFQLAATRISISPFTWDWVPVHIHGLTQEGIAPALVNWFMKWFDQDDEKTLDQQGLCGVVHYMSDPEVLGDSIHVDIDLGSVSEEALEALLFDLSDLGAIAIRVG